MLDSKENQIKIGDTVVFENGKTRGAVIYILESVSEIKLWAVDESGLMVESKPFGWVFLPASSFRDHLSRDRLWRRVQPVASIDLLLALIP